MNYRNKKILENARNNSCQHCGANDGTIVAAHSNLGRHGKGMSIKAHDCFVAYLCWICHPPLDQGFLFNRLEKEQLWTAAHKKSVPLFWGLLDEQGRATLENEGMGWEGLLT